MKKEFMSFCSHLLILTILSLSLWTPTAQASMVSNEQLNSSQAAQQGRAHLLQIFDRQDVRQQLQAKGVDMEVARSRVDALTDDEVATLNSKLDNLPAGGDIVGTAVFLFLVLLVTDILGFTKIFSFTRPIHHY